MSFKMWNSPLSNCKGYAVASLTTQYVASECGTSRWRAVACLNRPKDFFVFGVPDVGFVFLLVFSSESRCVVFWMLWVYVCILSDLQSIKDFVKLAPSVFDSSESREDRICVVYKSDRPYCASATIFLKQWFIRGVTVFLTSRPCLEIFNSKRFVGFYRLI